MIVDTVENELRAPKAVWSALIICKFRHIYLEWEPTDKIMFTRHELQKLRRNMSHSSNRALIELIKRAKLEYLD
jgi:hypothetical protein